MLRLIIILIALYVLYRMVRGLIVKKTDHLRDTRGGVMDELVQDPQCKIYIPERSSVKRTIGGRVYTFCSDECAKRFEERGETS